MRRKGYFAAVAESKPRSTHAAASTMSVGNVAVVDTAASATTSGEHVAVIDKKVEDSKASDKEGNAAADAEPAIMLLGGKKREWPELSDDDDDDNDDVEIAAAVEPMHAAASTLYPEVMNK